MSTTLKHRAAAGKTEEEEGSQRAAYPDPMSKVLTPGGMPERDPERENRGEFQSNFQYILACIGYAVGLGNIWRFPSLAYDNGGGAFLIAYIICTTLFGLPVLYMELIIGQFTQAGSSMAFRNYFPLLQGLGWASGLMSIMIGLYYNVIVAWVLLYMYHTVTGGVSKWSSCSNEWNTKYCESTLADESCIEKEEGNKFFNGSCHTINATDNSTFLFHEDGMKPMGPAEEFFLYNVLKAEMSFDNNNFNLPIAICLILSWTLITLGLWKGVKVLGKLSLITATTPYIIIAILFVRGVTLDGADIGFRYYLMEPKFEYLLELNTWRTALTQSCFSLSIGMGGMLTLASYNKRSHPCYRDALIIIGADSFMSIFGGVAVFSILGFISKQINVPINEVVQKGVTLAFVVYPEAIARMPLATLWAILFFFMLFFLGISTMFGYLESFLCCFLDQFPSLRTKRTPMMIAISACGCLTSSIFCFSAGIHWFQVLNEFIGAFALTIVLVGELILIIACYGPCRFFRDIRAMFGRPLGCWLQVFGSSGWYLKLTMCITSPILTMFVLIATFDIGRLSFGKGTRQYFYPDWVMVTGWIIGSVPIVFLPLMAIINVISFKKQGKPMSELITVQPEHPSIRYQLKHPKEADYDNYDGTAIESARTTQSLKTGRSAE